MKLSMTRRSSKVKSSSAAVAERLRYLALATLLIGVMLPHAPAFGQQQSRWSDVERIVAVADVHGAFTELVQLLQTTGIVDAELNWTGGTTHLVSVGDLLDRGPDSRRVMDLLIRLQRDSIEDGGGVHVVLGNHELMNLIGDLRYVSANEYAAFADDSTSALRASAYARFFARQASAIDAEAGQADAIDDDQTRALFEQRYPPGYFAHRRAFAPDGRYGTWLLSLPALIVINDTAFVHGGLPQLLSQSTLDAFNGRFRDDLTRYFELRKQLVTAGILPVYDMSRDYALAIDALRANAESSSNVDAAVISQVEEFVAVGNADELGIAGPLWYRGSVYCNPMLEQSVLDAALMQLEAARVVVGHTPTENRRVRELYDGKLIMLDTGMLVDYYSGRPAALIIENGTRTVQYLNATERSAPDRGHNVAFGLNRAEIIETLLQGSIATTARSEDGSPWQVTLSHNGRTIAAEFYASDRQGSANLEIAGFELDRLLGLNLVPPTVQREIDGELGALQLKFPNSISEAERVERGQGFSGWCSIDAQLQLMYAFDLLISNRGRSSSNIRYRQELSNLTLTDHGEAFGTQRRLPGSLLDDAIVLSPAVENALTALSENDLQSALGTRLNDRQIRALLARRDELVERF